MHQVMHIFGKTDQEVIMVVDRSGIQQHLENLRRNAQRRAQQYGPLVGLPANNSASNFAGAAIHRAKKLASTLAHYDGQRRSISYPPTAAITATLAKASGV